MFYDVYVLRGRHWKSVKGKPTENLSAAVRVWGKEPGSVLVSTNQKLGNTGVRLAKLVGTPQSNGPENPT